MSFMRLAQAILLSIAVMAAGCGKNDGKKAPVAGVQDTVQPISVMSSTALSRQVEGHVESTGTIFPWDEVTVSNEAPGVVEKIAADLGDRVAAGTPLAVLDQKEARLNLISAEADVATSMNALDREGARLSDAGMNLRRNEGLLKENMISQSVFDGIKTQFQVAEASAKEAEARLQSARARLNLAAKRLSDTVVKSPISGEVKKRFVSVGETVKDRVPFFTIVDARKLKFRGTVSEAMSSKVKNAQPVVVAIDALGAGGYRGAVTRISPAIDLETRTLEIEAVISNETGALRPGHFAKAMIITEAGKQAVFVPEAAVYSLAGITKVFAITENVAHERVITLGLKIDGTVQAIDAEGRLKAGDIVAVSNLQNLYEGAVVAIEAR
ncbi:MAG: efflux RND transporter periplasmic adaptor subunit [Deltaproteobacteria bacterium]